MIISISGKIGSGKDTVAEIIKQQSPLYKWEVKKFAGKLKEVATLLTGIPMEKWEDQEFKKTNLSSEWNRPIYFGGEFISDEPMTVRDLLQLLGTEAMRNGLHTNTWVNALFSDYLAQTVTVGDSEFNLSEQDKEPNWIITDTRFPNEVEAVKKRKGILIKVVRDSGNKVGTTHSSETALDKFNEWDYVIDNTGTIVELRQKVFDILSKENIIKYSSL